MANKPEPQPQKPLSDVEVDPKCTPPGGKFYFPEAPPRGGENTNQGKPFKVGGA